jgi:predicted MFS family arabinose efflux permease
MLAIATRVVASKEEGSTLSRALAGLRYLWRQPIVLGAISLDLFAVLFGGVNALLPVFSRDILHVGPAGLGVLRSTFAVGAIATSLVLAQLPEERQPHAGGALFGGVALFGAGAILFGLSGSFAIAMVALFIMGASDAMSVFVRATIVQLATPEDMRGRVSAIHVLFVGCTNELGEFRAGAFASLFGPVTAALAGGIGTLAVVALWTQLFPGLRRVDRLTEVDPASRA